MCEKNHVNSSRVLALMQTAGVVTDNLTNKKAHLVIPYRPCSDCSSECTGFIMNGGWHGLSQEEMDQYREQIHKFPDNQFIPG
jgi:hypothetical protein